MGRAASMSPFLDSAGVRSGVSDRMGTDRQDCTWCGSAASVEYGVCQICLMEFPTKATVISLPAKDRLAERTVKLDEPRQAGVGD